MHIEKINTINFRDISGLNFNFGNKLTFITGKNGTSKTSLLGLIAQPFTFTRKKAEGDYKTVTNRIFKAQFSDIHKFTKYDKIDTIEYELALSNLHGSKSLPVKGFLRKEKAESVNKNSDRLVVGKKRTAGEGNYPLPVIYLGLKRLFPLGEHSAKARIHKIDIERAESDFFNEYHKKVLLNFNDSKFIPEKVETPHKKMIGGNNGKYDSNGFSGGQDNISQILTAVLSFKRLKHKMGSNYKGGILLIDELEATFHPVAKEKLTDVLYKFASDYSLQIIVTTHSLEILEVAMQKKYNYRNDTQIIYLSKNRGALEYLAKSSYEKIKAEMTLKALVTNKEKITVTCEDDEAKTFLECILPKKIKEQIKIVPAKLDHGFLRRLSESNLGKNSKMIFVLDGDVILSSRMKKNKNIICLPGGSSPERVIYNFLEQKELDDDFFERSAKEYYFRNHPALPISREEFKSFFRYIKDNKSIFGNKGLYNCFNAWKSDNMDVVTSFSETFDNLLKRK